LTGYFLTDRVKRNLVVFLSVVPLMFGLTQCSSNSSTTNAGTTTSTGATIVPDPDTVSVTTYHYDNSRSGIQPQETALTPTNVNSSTFGKLFSVTVDGLVNAQPLIAANITMSDGQPHTLLLVATENDSVYAFNADTSAKAFWQRSLLQSGETAVPYAAIGTTDINPVIGIVGTPVLDATTNLLYVVAKSYTASGTFIQRLHAINIQTGAEAPNSPVTINPSIAGNASDAVNGQLSFNAKMENQRPALALNQGTVWVGWASHGDLPPYHGWLVGYDSSTLAQTYVFNDTPNGKLGGIWMSAGGPAFDSSGNLFVMSGNGDFSEASNNYSSSALRLTPGTGPNGSMTVADYFTPFNQASLSSYDSDFGVSGALLLPDQAGPYPHLLITSDKTSTVYVINRDNMGKYSSTANHVVQSFSGSDHYLKQDFVFFNNTLYVSGDSSPMNAYPFNPTTEQFQTTPSSSTSTIFTCLGSCWVGGSAPTISANGSANAVLWTVDNSPALVSGAAVLRAYDASNLSAELYDSTQAASNRDQAANAVKFTTPVVANGHVYVGGVNAVTVYGLLSQ
jgi:hypothetical protein